MKRIAIIGGGPSGLFSAFLLAQKANERLDITLFECQARLGGKVLTKRFDTAQLLYEGGVAELYRYGNDPLWELITQELELPTLPMSGSAVVFEGQILRCEQDILRHCGKNTVRALREFQQRVRALRPYREFYDGGWPADNRHPWMSHSFGDLLAGVSDENARRYLKILIHSDLATEPHLTHGLYGADNYLINESDYCKLYSIEGGIIRLVEALAQKLSARVWLKTCVSGICKTEHGTYRTVFSERGKRAAEEFDAILIALPVYALRQLTWGGKFLRMAVESHIARYDDPAHYLRITALFREPFWRGVFDDSYFIHDAFGGCCVYDEGARQKARSNGILSWLIGGNDALALHSCSDQRLVEMALDSLPSAMIGACSPHDLLLEGHVDRWIGMVYGMPGGRRLMGSKKRHYLEPEEHRGLIIVGDYLFDSTINGAFDSADIATDLLLKHLANHRSVEPRKRSRPLAQTQERSNP